MGVATTSPRTGSEEIDAEFLVSLGFKAVEIQCSGEPEEDVPPHSYFAYEIAIPFEDYEQDDEPDDRRKCLFVEIASEHWANEMCRIEVHDNTTFREEGVFVKFPSTRRELMELCSLLGIELRKLEPT